MFIHRIRGIGTFTYIYIYHKNQSFMLGKYPIFPMDARVLGSPWSCGLVLKRGPQVLRPRRWIASPSWVFGEPSGRQHEAIGFGLPYIVDIYGFFPLKPWGGVILTDGVSEIRPSAALEVVFFEHPSIYEWFFFHPRWLAGFLHQIFVRMRRGISEGMSGPTPQLQIGKVWHDCVFGRLGLRSWFFFFWGGGEKRNGRNWHFL